MPTETVEEMITIERGIARSETRSAIALTTLHQSSDCTQPLRNHRARMAPGVGNSGTSRFISAEPATASPNDQRGLKKCASTPLASCPQA